MTLESMPHSRIIPVDVTARLDTFLAQKLPEYSRTLLQSLIEQGRVKINGTVFLKPSKVVVAENLIELTCVQETSNLRDISREVAGLGVTLVFEHADFAIINKPAGLLVHAAATAPTEITLVDWIQTYISIQGLVPSERTGIIHRLDRDTSGLMVVVKNPQAQLIFSRLFKDRTIKKKYLALVEGRPPAQATIDYNIVRHPTQRIKMTHSFSQGRAALTTMRLIEQYDAMALIEASPLTGRTHQIRVHCAVWGHPIIADAVYHVPSPLIGRQALHAAELSFEYRGEKYVFTQDMPEDMNQVIKTARFKHL